MSNQQSNIQAPSSFPGQIPQTQMRKQQANPPTVSKPQSQPIPPPNSQPQSKPSHPLQQIQQPKGHLATQSTPMSIPQSSQVPNLTQLPQHTASQSPSLHQPSVPSLSSQSQQPSHHQPQIHSLSTQSQQPLQTTGSQYLPLQPPLQPPIPPQQRPPAQGFPHQGHAQMGPGFGFQHPSGQQMHHSQHMFHVR